MPANAETQDLNIYIQRGPIDTKKRQLIITLDFIQFEDNSGLDPFTLFQKEEVCEYRYGINWIRGFEFTIGREYVILIRDSSGRTMKISFKSFYGRRKKEYHKLSNDILTTLWYCFFGNMANDYFNKIKKGEDITIGRALITKDAIIVDEGGILKKDKKVIPWQDLGMKDYHTYFAIFSKDNAAKAHATFSYFKDWNTGILFSIIKTFLNKMELNKSWAANKTAE